MKCFDKLVLRHIKDNVPAGFDPHQYAVRTNRPTEDAISTALSSGCKHLEIKNSYIRILFVDFSSACNSAMKLNGNLNTLIIFHQGAVESILTGNMTKWHGSSRPRTGSLYNAWLKPPRTSLVPSTEHQWQRYWKLTPTHPQSVHPAAVWQQTHKYLLPYHQTRQQLYSWSFAPQLIINTRTWMVCLLFILNFERRKSIPLSVPQQKEKKRKEKALGSQNRAISFHHFRAAAFLRFRKTTFSWTSWPLVHKHKQHFSSSNSDSLKRPQKCFNNFGFSVSLSKMFREMMMSHLSTRESPFIFSFPAAPLQCARKLLATNQHMLTMSFSGIWCIGDVDFIATCWHALVIVFCALVCMEIFWKIKVVWKAFFFLNEGGKYLFMEKIN